MDQENYIIVEIIPTARTRKQGEIAQISALKLKGLTLLERFDYRLKEEQIKIKDILQIISYDKEMFTYEKTTKAILKKFKKFISNFPIIIIDNEYTRDYLSEFDNLLFPIHEILDVNNNDFLIKEIMRKYHLEPSDHIVDLLYEGIIKKK